MITPQQESVIIHESAKRTPCREISKQVGIHYSTINRIQQNLRPLIEAEMAELLSKGLAASRATTVKFAEYGASEKCVPGETDEKWAKLSLDASKAIQAIVTTSQPGTVINALIQINESPQQTAELDTLTNFLQTHWGSKMIDVPTAHTDPTDTDVIEADRVVDTSG